MVKESRNVTATSSAAATSTEDKERYWKTVLVVDDDLDITTTFKMGIENGSNASNKKIAVHAYNDPIAALTEFKPNFYDLLLTDINMPGMNGFQLSKEILNIDVNVKVCFMSSGEINLDALREVYPSMSFGCFIKKPVTIDYLIQRVMAELE